MPWYKNLMKIKVNYIDGEKKSTALGINKISIELISKLTKRVEFKSFNYKNPHNNPLIRQLTIYCFYPIKTAIKLINNSDIIHIYSQGYAYLSHFLPKQKLIITCCDLTPLVYSQTNNFWQNMLLKYSFSGLKKANKIITISKSTKTELIKYLKIPEQKIIVIYPSIDEKFSILKENRKNELKKRLFSDKKVILYVGSYLKNKNINGLIKVFYEIHKEIKNAILVIVNEKEKIPKEYLDLINNLGIQEIVQFTGYVSDQELVNIFNCSDVLIYPSLYEGFGFPPLEAMACGCPVITSNTSSLPEVVGDAGILVNPNNYNEIAKNAIMLLKNPTIRNKMIIKGLKQAKKFRNSPSEKVLDVYKKLI